MHTSSTIKHDCMKYCTYDILFAPLTREQKLASLKLMTLFGATAAPSSENINLINRIMSRSAKAMGVSGDAVRSYDFGSIENATAILGSITDREALDLLFLVFFNIISIGKDENAANLLANIYESLGYEDNDLESLIKKGQKEGVFLTKKTPDVMYLNKIAISMGKMNKMLDGIETKIRSAVDARKNWEDLVLYAYICRIAILDRIDEHRGHLTENLPITIPLGLIRTRKETMESAINLTVQRLYDIAYLDEEVGFNVEMVLRRKGKFDEIDSMYSEEQKLKLIS